MYFLDIYEDLALGLLREIALQFLDLGAFAADDDARTRCANRNTQFVARPIYFHGADTGRLQPIEQRFLEREIFVQKSGVFLLCKPARAPRFGHAQSESVRMYFLAH